MSLNDYIEDLRKDREVSVSTEQLTEIVHNKLDFSAWVMDILEGLSSLDNVTKLNVSVLIANEDFNPKAFWRAYIELVYLKNN